jgi:hypothetical protein
MWSDSAAFYNTLHCIMQLEMVSDDTQDIPLYDHLTSLGNKTRHLTLCAANSEQPKFCHRFLCKLLSIFAQPYLYTVR